MLEAKQLDKFYTREELARQLIDITKKTLNITDEMFLEPSAGSGSFSSLLDNCIAYDIKPEGEGIIQADFFKVVLDRNDYISIGNPPFGNRCLLAIDFFNKCAKHSKAIAFILPITFMKWSVQSQLDNNFSLIYSEQLDENSFTFLEEEYSVRTCFQIWVKKSEYPWFKDVRLTRRPPTSHIDFDIWQHNATEESRKYVDEPWEIATYRQGYKDYNKIFTREDYDWLKEQVYNTNIQFFFIKPKTEEARKVIGEMDFDKLSKRNMATPGFGKGDFVAYYEEILNS
jgi:hypothetical protein